MIFTACEGRAVDLAAASVKWFHCTSAFSQPPTLLSLRLLMFQLQRAPLVRTRHLRLRGQEQPRAERRQGRRGSGEAGHTLQRACEAPWSASLPVITVFCLVIKQVVRRSSHWWLIRNHGEEGSVPQNVLELISSSPVEDQQVSRARRRSSNFTSGFNPFVLGHSGTPAGSPPWT